MTSVKAPSGSSAAYEFDAAGNRTKSVWGNGTYAYYGYDAVGRTEEIRHFASAGTALAYFDYSRDARGDITKSARLDGLTTYYDYDAVGRLTYETWKDSGGTALYAFTYDYDLAGNRTAGSILGTATYWAYNDAAALTERWTVPAGGGPADAAYYSYDLDGSLQVIKELPGGSFTYFEHGGHGLVTSIKPLGGTEVTFAYDGLLRRIRMSEGATHTYFRHDGINLLEIAKSDGTLTKVTHGYTPIDGIASVVEVDIDGTTYYFHQGPRGTPYKITDANENVVWTGLCDAWGKALSETGTNPTIFWYQGQAWIKIIVNGRTYYISPTRIYDPEDARFLQKDPVGSMVLVGAYGYVWGFPVRLVDPSGLRTKLKKRQLKRVAREFLLTVQNKGVFNWSPSANTFFIEPLPSLRKRAAWYCGAGIAQAKYERLTFEVGVHAMMSAIKVVKVLYGAGIMEWLKDQAKEAIKRLIEEKIKEYVERKQLQIVAWATPKTGDCFCEYTMFYDPDTQEIKGIITGKVGTGVARLGQTTCCPPEQFFYACKAKVKDPKRWSLKFTEFTWYTEKQLKAPKALRA